jgi:hypothetical protein
MLLASGPERHAEGRNRPSAPKKAIPRPFGLQEPSWGPRRPLSVVDPALSVVFGGYRLVGGGKN